MDELDEDELELDEDEDDELELELEVPPKLDELDVELTLPDEDDELDDEEEEDDEVELETLPDELEVELTLPDDVLEVLLTPPVEVDDVLLTPPVDVEEPPVELVEVELTPPVEVDDPPDEVDVEPPELDEVLDTPPDVLLTPPVEVDEPPEDVEEPPDEVEPPLDVEETTMLPPPLPPPKPPTKKPPPKPPPKPPEPPTTTGTPPPPPLDRIGPSGSGIGAPPCDATVTVAGAQAWVVTVRVMRFTTRRAGARAAMRLRGAFLTLWVLTYAVFGWLVACIAPPPMTAPPQAQAQSFASAIRTDITLIPYPIEEMRLPPRPLHRPVTHSDCISLEIPATRLTLIIARPNRFTKSCSQSFWLMSHKGAVSFQSLTQMPLRRGKPFPRLRPSVRQFTVDQCSPRYIRFRLRGGLYAV